MAAVVQRAPIANKSLLLSPDASSENVSTPTDRRTRHAPYGSRTVRIVGKRPIGYGRLVVRLFGSNAIRALLITAALLGSAAPAMAQDTGGEEQLAAARQLFNEGKDLEKTGQWAEALSRFKKVAEVKMTPQVRFHIALCEENLGRMVNAINGYEVAAGEARQVGAAANDVAANAPQRAEALRARVPKLRIVVTGTTTRSRVLLDRAPVAAGLLDTDIPVDPGTHQVEVETDGKPNARKEVTLAEKASERVELSVVEPELPAAAAAAPAAPTAPAAPPPDKQGLFHFPPPVPAIIAGGIGLAGFAAAGIFFGLRQQTIAEVRDSCTDPSRDRGCDPDTRDIAERGETWNLLTDVFLGVGGAGLVAGGVLWLVLPGAEGGGEKKAATPQRRIGVVPGPGSVRVTGSF